MNGKTETLKQKQGKFKTKYNCQIKNSLGEFNSTMDMTEEKVSALKDQLIEIIQSEKQREKNIGGEKNNKASDL